MRYNQKLDELFNEWKEGLSESEKEQFVSDGIQYRGQISDRNRISGENLSVNSNKEIDGWDENIAWHESDLRVMFLNKEGNGHGGDDTRTWVNHDPGATFDITFFRAMARYLYGIVEASRTGGTFPDYDGLDMQKVTELYDNHPLALMNLKKVAGGSVASEKEVLEHAQRDKKFLQKQIQILKPHIIIIGGASWNYVDFVSRQLMEWEDCDHYQGWIYFSPRNPGTILLHNYHPSYISDNKKLYNNCLNGFSGFLRECTAAEAWQQSRRSQEQAN